MKKHVAGVFEDQQSWISKAESMGMKMKFNTFVAARRETLHIMINDEAGRRLVDYWPGNGTLMVNRRNKRKAASIEEALMVAIDVNGAANSDETIIVEEPTTWITNNLKH